MTHTFTSEKDRFEAAGQGHVFAFWDQLEEAARSRLLDEAASIDLAEIQHLVDTLVQGSDSQAVSLEGLEPAPFIKHPQHGGDAALWAEARGIGESALRAGKVAAFTVAGGQGTRLGYYGPKGTFPVTPVREKPLFAVFADKLLAAGERYGVRIPWFIMTSSVNHAATVAAFEEADYFGLETDQVMFFSQGRMPAVDFSGRILMDNPASISMSPDGHGGSLRALVRSGAIERMQQSGIEVISYFQVDNPLVQVIDPAFIGFHIREQSEMSSKMIPKAYPGEKVGMFCQQEDKMVVLEYSDMPMDMQEERDADDELRYLAGSIAIHILDVGFVARIGGGDAEAQLPFHKAVKKVKTIDSDGNLLHPEEPNGVKFEMFVFDALPFARNPVVIETLREDDFSPVKNATGIDSAESSRADQIRQWTRWLGAAGVDLATDETGLPPFTFEVGPRFGDSEEAFVKSWLALEEKPAITDGVILDKDV
ncbi:MAG: UTP--glucose-1-phosphate uridylyltransferase [Puniceicoccaceae bacterium]